MTQRRAPEDGVRVTCKGGDVISLHSQPSTCKLHEPKFSFRLAAVQVKGVRIVWLPRSWARYGTSKSGFVKTSQ